MMLFIVLLGEVKKVVGLYEVVIGLGMVGGLFVGGVLGNVFWRLFFFGISVLIFIVFILVLMIVK